MPIYVRDPIDHDPQWRDRKKKDLPPEVLKIAEVLNFELRGHLKPEVPPGIILQAAIAVTREFQLIEIGVRSEGADATNASKRAAKERVRTLWFKLSEQERARRGGVLSFAIKTASVVEGTTEGGIKKWVSEFRKENRRR